MGKKKILIVEDSAVIVAELESRIEDLGYAVCATADTGRAAIRAVEATHPDLVLMDIMLKGPMDGIQAAEIIRNRFSVPVIFATAHADEKNLKRARLTLPFGYLLKPFQNRDLRVAIEMALHVARVDAERKKAEAALRQSEDRLRVLINTAPDLICFKDGRGRWLMANDYALRLFQLEGVDYRGKTNAELARLSPTLRDTFKTCGLTDEAAWQKAAADRGGQTFSQPDGSSLIFDVIKVPIFKRDGGRDALVVCGRDITEIRRTEAALRESEKKCRLLAENVSDVIWTMDRHLRFTYISPSVTRMRGYSVEEAMALTLEKTLSPASLEKAKKVFAEIMANRRNAGSGQIQSESRILELENFCKDGSTIWVEATLSFLFDKNGHFDGIVGVSRDITGRKATESSLSESEARFRSLAQSANDAIIVADDKGTIISWNKAAEVIFGYREADVLGRPLTTMMPERYRDRHDTAIERVRSGGKPRVIGTTVGLTGLRKDGREFPIELSLSSWRSGNKSFYSAIVRDVTERKAMEKNITAALKEKEILLKEIHHRVKNNLQTISSLLYLQAERTGDSRAAAILLDTRNRVRSMAIVHECLYLSGNMAGIDLSEYIRNLTAHLFHAYGVSPARVAFEIESDDILLPVDTAIPCGLIINELVSNCLKYAFPSVAGDAPAKTDRGNRERGGEIRIGLDRDRQTDAFTLQVSDNGVGLPEKLDFRHIRTLGLYLVNTLVKQIGGTLALDRNGGTTFRITGIPLH